ncbi:MAG: extracellular solute-binding protein [Anaerolineae bacterium]|nr:extracellular solute-binding protein [Anaerolineae bacterium]
MPTHRRIAATIAAGLLLAVGMAACAENAPGPVADRAAEQADETNPAQHAATPVPTAATRGSNAAGPGQALLRNASVSDNDQEPLAQVEDSEPSTIRVWWPDALYPETSSTAETILASQFQGFTLTYSSYDLEVRRKRSTGLGGILATLRAAKPVAPGAIPDMTLMRRTDMITAANEGLIVPITDWVPTDIINDNLIPGARALGEIDGVLYGVPYALSLYHAVYRESVFTDPPLTFADVLDQQPVYLFPAGMEGGTLLNRTVLLQYRAAGGTVEDEDGNPTLDREALLAVLTFYEQAVTAGVFDDSLLAYSAPEDYLNDFITGEANMIMLDSITYLRHKDEVQNVGLMPLPTQDGTPVSALDGWMWVLTTHDPDRQEQTRTFISWMMRASQQSIYTEALGILPSQLRALETWDDTVYASFAQDLIPRSYVIRNTERSNSAAIALQNSLANVLKGMSAEDATDTALEALTG